MKNIMNIIEKKFAPVFGKLNQNPYIQGLRDGMIATIPFTIIGSLFIIIQQFPVDAWLEFVKPYSAMLAVPNTMTMGIIALYTSFAIGYHMGKAFKQDQMMCGLISFVGFMMLQVDAEFKLTTAYFGSKGIFPAIIIAIFSVKIIELFTKKGLYIKFPKGVPAAVSKAFASLIPSFVILVTLFVIRCVFNIQIQELIIGIFSPLVFALNTLPGILVFMLVSQTLWCAGIHGMSIVNAVGSPIFLTFIAANQEAFLAGEKIPYITANGFISNFVSLGGAGATLALVLLMCRSKEKSFQMLGRLALPAGAFNINEPIIFGFPIVMNPVMMFPFILVDMVLITGTYLLMYFGIIGLPVANVPWVMPPVIGAYLVTGGNIPAAIWTACGLVIAIAIYYPFFKIAERQRLDEIKENTEGSAV